MESLIANNLKQKKRKSRKRLNAIRKKALENAIVNINNFHKGYDVKTNNKNSFCTHKNTTSICITTKRLTLFNKAVASDTVSRTNILKNKLYGNDYKKDANTVAKLMSPLNRQVTKVLTTNQVNQKEGGVTCITKNCNDCEFSCKTQSSVVLFSSSNQPEDLDISKMFQIDRNQSKQVATDPINNSSRDNKSYNDFLNKIPNYLKRMAPALLKTDFLHKCKMSLTNLYMENYHLNIKECSGSLSGFSCYDSSQENIIQNPTDLDYSYEEVSSPDLESSSLCSIVSNSIMGLSSSPQSMVVSDSPEYIYYPHRLNH